MDKRTLAQRWADLVTEFSGSWPFIIWFGVLSVLWIIINCFPKTTFDPYPFLFLNWFLTIVSTFQSPLIMMSNNRQNDVDRDYVKELNRKLDSILEKLNEA